MSIKLHWPEPRVGSLDFAPEILAIQERPPSPLPRAVLYTLLTLFASLVVWACFGKLDIVATAQGKLVPRTYVKIVQPADSGIVRDILVHEGDHVTKGQVLLRLDTTLAGADRAIVEKEVQLRRLQLQRIDAELSGNAMSPGADASELFAQVEAQAQARVRALRDAVATETELLKQAEEDLASAEAQAQKLEQLLPIFQKEEESLLKLAVDGLVPRFQAAEKQRERIETEQNLASQRRAVGIAVSRIAESKGRLARLNSDYRQQLFGERVEAQAAFERAQQELAKQRHRSELNELRAPQDGIIKEVATYTVGAVVAAGTVLMSLVPVEEELVAEVYIRNEDVGFVHVGQSVKVKLAAFPFQKYGMLNGMVTRIAADAFEPSASGASSNDEGPDESGVSPYKAIVEVATQQLKSQGHAWRLAPGMQIAAEIKQGERTVLEYLLSPVQRVMHDFGRER